MKKLLSVLLLFIVVFSCGSSNSGGSNQLKSVIVNLDQEGASLDSTLVQDESGNTIVAHLNEGLLKVNYNTNKVEPGLAESYEVSEDGLTWKFKLREGLKWSDGSALTAKDFEYAWKRALDPKTAAPYAYMLYPIANAEEYNQGKVEADKLGIKVIDDLNIEVTLKVPTPYFDWLASFTTYYPVSQAAVEKFGDTYAVEPENFVTSGAYKVVSIESGASVKIEKNENYYNASNVKIDTIEFKYIADPAAYLNAYNNDELDLIKITAEQYSQNKDNKEIVAKEMPAVWFLQYNYSNKVLANSKIRKAFLLAIDKENIANNVLNGVQKAIYSFTPGKTGILGYEKDFVEEAGENIPKFNPEEAKKLLAEGLKELGLDKLPELSIILNDAGSNKKVGEALQESLRVNLGVDVQIELMAFKERVARMKANDFDLVLAGWSADFLDPINFLDLYITNGGNNHGKFSNAEYDALVKKANNTADKRERVDTLIELEKMVASELPIAPLYQARYIFLVKPRLVGAEFPSAGPKFYLVNADVK